MTQNNNERLRRWRLILGDGQAARICTEAGDNSLTLSGTDQAIDNTLSALYDSDAFGGLRQSSGGLGSSSPKAARWQLLLSTLAFLGITRSANSDSCV